MIRSLAAILALALIPNLAQAQSIETQECGRLGASNLIAEPWEQHSIGRGDGQVRIYKAWDYETDGYPASVLILTRLNTGSDGPPRLCEVLLRAAEIPMDRAQGYDDRDSVVFFVPYTPLDGGEEQELGFRVDLSTGELRPM